jgi:two-component system, chemotaxis family, CheB/CheR fusion protein
MSQTHVRPPMAAGGGGRSILLIDDDPHVAETLGELLGLEGFRVTVAQDAITGLVRARADRPDLVLCDLTLRGELDGRGFAAACRADPALRGLRLAAVSGYDRPDDVRGAMEAGFDCLIPKPVDLALIYAALPPAPGTIG